MTYVKKITPSVRGNPVREFWTQVSTHTHRYTHTSKKGGFPFGLSRCIKIPFLFSTMFIVITHLWKLIHPSVPPSYKTGFLSFDPSVLSYIRLCINECLYMWKSKFPLCIFNTTSVIDVCLNSIVDSRGIIQVFWCLCTTLSYE